MTTPPLDLPAERLTALRDIANAATDGPWNEDTYTYTDGVRVTRADAWHPAGKETLASPSRREDVTFIAAFDPPTVLALLDRAEAAEAKVAAVREAVEAHPKACDRHTEDDPIKCGWKRAVADVTHALDSTPYRTLSTEPLVSTHHTTETETAP